MRTHQDIDRRSLALAQAVVEKLESGNLDDGLNHVRAVNRRWREQNPSPLHEEWARILAGDWPSIRTACLMTPNAARNCGRTAPSAES